MDNSNQDLQGFTNDQIKFAALCWATRLVCDEMTFWQEFMPVFTSGRGAQDSPEMRQKIVTASQRQGTPLSLLKLSQMLEALSREVFAMTQNPDKNILSENGLRYVVLPETEHYLNPVLGKIFDDAGIFPRGRGEDRYDKALILHADGQLYYDKGGNSDPLQIVYRGCPEPAFQIITLSDLPFGNQVYQTLYDRVMMINVEKGQAVPAAAPRSDMLPIASYNEQIRRFKVPASVAIRETNVTGGFDAIEPADLLNPQNPHFDMRSLIVTAQLPERGEGVYVSTGRVRGELLMPTDRPGVYRSCSLPFKRAVTFSPVQYGAGKGSVCKNAGETVIQSMFFSDMTIEQKAGIKYEQGAGSEMRGSNLPPNLQLLTLQP